jgi:hypothetical protein
LGLTAPIPVTTTLRFIQYASQAHDTPAPVSGP